MAGRLSLKSLCASVCLSDNDIPAHSQNSNIVIGDTTLRDGCWCTGVGNLFPHTVLPDSGQWRFVSKSIIQITRKRKHLSGSVLA